MQTLKELVAVLVLTAPAWWLARRLLSPVMAAGSFEGRLAVWTLLTVTALLAPSIWVYAAVAVPAMVWLGRRDPNPAAACVLLLYAVPNALIDLPSALVNELFPIGHQRLMALALLLPCWWRARATGPQAEDSTRWSASSSSWWWRWWRPTCRTTRSRTRCGARCWCPWT